MGMVNAMIERVIRHYQELKTHPDTMNKLTDNKRLFLATMIAGMSPEQEKRYWETAAEISRTASSDSELKRMRHIAAAFLTRGRFTPNQTIGIYQEVEQTVKEHRVSRFLSSTQVVITVLLALQKMSSDSEIDLDDRVTRLLAVYREWRKRHRFLTSGRLLPLMTIAVGLYPTRRPAELVADVEMGYLQLVQLGLPKTEDTVRFAWALLWSQRDLADVQRLHALWLQSFKANKFLKSGVIKQAQTLSLLGIEPDNALDVILYHFNLLNRDSQFCWHSRYALLHPAVQSYLRATHSERLNGDMHGLTLYVQAEYQGIETFDLLLLDGALAGISSSGFDSGDGGDGGGGE